MVTRSNRLSLSRADESAEEGGGDESPNRGCSHYRRPQRLRQICVALGDAQSFGAPYLFVDEATKSGG